MWVKLLISISTLSLLMTLPVRAQQEPSEFNPFSKPDLLKLKPARKKPVAPVYRQRPKNEEPEFNLSATLISVNIPMAIVNKKLLQVGKEVDGMKLLMVDEGRVVLRYKGKKYHLSIDPSAAAQNQTAPAATTELQETM